ncbi:MAG: VWA domain-containing protein [Verrucomicrobia bacterium]|nr:VWA domain-containing protein [Verrucomicrobiota bacterium]
MTFAHPHILWLMAIAVPAVALFLIWAWRTRQALMRQFVQSRLLAQLTVGVSPARQKIRAGLLVGAVALLFLALAGPRYGFEWEEARQRGLDIVVAIDTSRSMLATDLAPNRLERSKLEAMDLLKLARNDRLGLVAFAGSSFLQCPLTLDEDAFRQSVQVLDTSIIPQGGTDLAGAIKTALTAFKDEKDNHKILVIFTDGEDHEAGAVEAARAAAKEGLKIFTVGVGTASGEILKVRDEKGVSDFLKDGSGNVVKSRLNEPLLQELATLTSGFYLPLKGTKTMATLYEQGLAPLPKSESDSKLLKKYHERFAWPLGLGILLLMIELFIPDRKRPPAAPNTPATSSLPWGQGSGTAIAILLLLTGLPVVQASTSSAKQDFEAGRYKESAQKWDKLAQAKPDDAKLRFNAGTSALASGQLEQAAGHLEASLATPDLELQQRSYYNLGHALFQGGEQSTDAQEKLKQWESAQSRFESALKLKPADADAAHNLNYIRNRIEELKKQMEKKKDDSQKQDSKDEREDDDKPDSKEGEERSKQDQGQPDQSDREQDSKKDSRSKGEEGEPEDEKKGQQEQQPQKDPKEPEPSEKNAKESKDQNKSSDSAQQEGSEGSPAQQGSSTAAQQGQMTPDQAAKILDAQKGEERAMIFVPPKSSKQRVRILKDW